MSENEQQAKNSADENKQATSKLIVQTIVGQRGSIGYSASLVGSAQDRDDL